MAFLIARLDARWFFVALARVLDAMIWCGKNGAECIISGVAYPALKYLHNPN